MRQMKIAVNETKTHILICDDDANFVAVLADYLKQRGYAVTTDREANKPFDICLLDAQTVDFNNLDILDTPVILMGEHMSQNDIINAYKNGIDAFVEKPLAVEILICKIEAILRRCRKQNNNDEKIFEYNGKLFDGVQQTFNGQHMSARENDLLLLLWRNKGELVDRHQILRSLWKEDNYFASRSLSVYINRLRHILSNTNLKIVAVNKRGYKLIEQQS